MVVQMEGGNLSRELQIAQEIRTHGLRVELYPESSKLKKQFKYANDRHATWVVILGEEELTNGQVSLKNMEAGSQHSMALGDALEAMGV